MKISLTVITLPLGLQEELNYPRLEGDEFSNSLSTSSRPLGKIVTIRETLQNDMLMVSSTPNLQNNSTVLSRYYRTFSLRLKTRNFQHPRKRHQ